MVDQAQKEDLGIKPVHLEAINRLGTIERILVLLANSSPVESVGTVLAVAFLMKDKHKTTLEATPMRVLGRRLEVEATTEEASLFPILVLSVPTAEGLLEVATAVASAVLIRLVEETVGGLDRLLSLQTHQTTTHLELHGDEKENN